MSHSRRFCLRVAPILSALFLAVALVPRLAGQSLAPALYRGMRWRLIGPYRAGRVTAVAGIAGNPAVYYMGTPGGGIWKTSDGGTVWKPIFDAAHVASIGALAVAPSDPRVLYAGTGEQSLGQGVYKSTDAGATWTPIGLADTHYINSVLVDPRDPQTVLVGAMGDPSASQARGVYKTTDGGRNWKKVLYKDDRTGVADLCQDPEDPRVVYAVMWRAEFRVFFPPAGKPEPGPDAWIYKSTDEGSTWKRLEAHGLPEGKWGRTGIAVAPGDHGRRLFAILGQGLFRSDNAGQDWQRITEDPRITGSSYFSRVFTDPRNPEIVYVMQTSLYRSSDGGRHFIAFKGSPGGDDYHVMWIDPANPRRMILGVDQGATISVDGGKTWTPWYNQPTGQFYHVTTGGGFPYYAYAQQQDSGSAAVPNRTDFGQIRYRDWFSPGGYEFGYMAADPTHPNLVYSGNESGSVAKFDRRTSQLTFLFVHGPQYRTASNAPLIVAPQNPEALYFGTQFVMKSTDRGRTWRKISPDLTLPPGAPEGKNHRSDRRFAVITTLALSRLHAGEIWAGTSDGLVELSRDDGSTWQNVTPPELGPRSLVSLIEASRFDEGTAYAAVDGFNDSRPYFYRTRDFGKSWQSIVVGLANTGIARVVREDPVRQGLLYAGTETGVYVSFDRGDHWQSLQLNLPTASVRDLNVHGNDLVAATFGRALWILDDLTPLREADAAIGQQGVHFFAPEEAIRVRGDQTNDTPLPPEVPTGENPPNGAILDYYLKTAPSDPIRLALYDAKGNLVRQFSSVPAPPEAIPANVPAYWFAPPTALPNRAGMNRFVWNLRYAHPLALPSELSRARGDYRVYSEVHDAILGKTPRHYPLGPLVVPGDYRAVLTVDGQTYRQTLVVRMDPRVDVAPGDLVAQLKVERQISSGMAASFAAYHQVRALQEALDRRKKEMASQAKAKEAVENLAKKLSDLEEGTRETPGFDRVNRALAELLDMTESSDSRPTDSAASTVAAVCQALTKKAEAWHRIESEDLPVLNSLLGKYKLAPLTAAPADQAGCRSAPD